MQALTSRKPEQSSESEFAGKQAELHQLENDLKLVSSNLARAATAEQYNVISSTFEELEARRRQLASDVTSLKRKPVSQDDSQGEVGDLLELVERLTELAGASNDYSVARELFELTNLRLFFDFEPAKLKKRVVNKLSGGVVTFGSAEPPITLYSRSRSITVRRPPRSSSGRSVIRPASLLDRSYAEIKFVPVVRETRQGM